MHSLSWAIVLLTTASRSLSINLQSRKTCSGLFHFLCVVFIIVTFGIVNFDIELVLSLQFSLKNCMPVFVLIIFE
jgi:hypothetical protein